MIHIAWTSVYPTEAEARVGIVADLQPLYSGVPYLGVWTMPDPYRTEVHVFTTTAAEVLEAGGWTRTEEPT